MTSLHAYFHNRDQVAFQRHLSTALTTDVNARDWLGRTVLHLACAASAKPATEYVRLLLAHPGIDVNSQDAESHWTALHRALYDGNLAAAILLLQRGDIDTSLKDSEGYRAFDLYNTTVEDTMPSKRGTRSGLELYTWGSNRNASLGHGDTDDRTHPEQVVLKHHDVGEDSKALGDIAFKLQPAMAWDVRMSRLHTVVLTDESRANIRACGFASAGRLGPGGGQHTQPSFLPVLKRDLDTAFIAIALGQDHTLALTSDGTILSWGLGRFSQLGYELPPPHVQFSPRAIAGPLRRERVRGIAACKSASACWTDTALYTWGKNNGQLGYDKTATPVQSIPRVVTKVTKPVISVALNDTAMACLLDTQDVVLLSNDTHARITFPSPTRLPSDFLAYRPPQAARAITTARIFCNESTFATVSSAGEIFTFSAPAPAHSGERQLPVQPQRVWALRKQWSAVHDAALGVDGSLVICTQSGHVFVRSRGGTGAKLPRFVRVTGLQRAIAVRASDSGALAALREPYPPPSITPVGNSLAEDLARLRPYFSFTRPDDQGTRIDSMPESSADALAVEDLPDVTVTTYGEEEGDGSFDLEAELLVRDAREVMRLWDILAQDRIARKRPRLEADAPVPGQEQGQGLFAKGKLSHGADIMLRVQNSTDFPAHRTILSARCAVLARVLGGLGSLHDRESGISFKLLPAPVQRIGASASCPPQTPSEAPRLAITGVHPFSVLILLHYLYTDILLAINDPQLARLTGIADAFTHGRLQPAQAVHDLLTLLRVLHLEALDYPLRSVVRRAPSPSLNSHFRAIFDAPMTSVFSPDVDVVLRLADRDVRTHSFVLRARSLFFECFFSDEEWTRDRWGSDGILRVDLCHLEWRAMQYVLRYMCCGEEAEMFERLDFIDSIDELLSLLFDVMFAANELLLDRLLLICSSIIVKYVSIHNVSAIYMEAASLHCPQLMDSLHQYMSVNMETLLEARLLDDLPPWHIKHLAGAVQGHQAAKSPISRLQLPVNRAASVDEHRDWLAAEDIPHPIVRSQPKVQPKPSPKVSRKASQQPASPKTPTTPSVAMPRTSLLAHTSEDLFCMDEALVPPLNLGPDLGVGSSADREELGSAPKVGPWKAKSTPPRVDMKTILAEAEEMQAGSAGGRTQHLHPTASSLTSMHRQRSGDGMRVSFSLPKTHDIQPHSSSPSSSRSTSNPVWRIPNPSRLSAMEPLSLSPGRSSTITTATATTMTHRQTPPRISPPGSMQVSSERPSPTRPFSAPAVQKSKSWSSQSSPSPGPSTLTHPGRLPSLGPTISPSKAKVKAGQTATSHHASSGGNVWTLPSVETVCQPSPSVPISFAEIQQLQSQPSNTAINAKERQSLRDIQAEEAELQAEAEFMKWWTAEEERIRLENEAMAAALLQSATQQNPKQQQQRPHHHHHHGKRNKKPATTAEGDTVTSPTSGPRAPRGKRKVT